MEKIITEGTKIHLAPEPVDMRKSFDALYAQVSEHLNLKPFSEAMFVFTNKTRTRVKILHWDGSGLWVMAKRLEEGRFSWPKSAGVGKQAGAWLDCATDVTQRYRTEAWRKKKRGMRRE